MPDVWPDPALRAAYEATSYILALPDGPVTLRVGVPAPALDAWLTAHGHDVWAWLTAFNPQSRRLADDDNARRLDALKSALRAAGWSWLEGRALADDARWPEEQSVFVAGMSRSDALGLAAAWGQAAILCGCNGGEPDLAWIAEKS
jgi:hypothetical protein